ncbi:esterase 6-like [Eupeodes corollae]|uniref:esterase 6-like n=1 Tax=Eupeodes corollae TaxID=290404 RepID=UPI0024916AA5|nr:esterase 6-like [Eupeodes corollae]
MCSFRVVLFVTIFGFAYSNSAPIIKLPYGQLQGSIVDNYNSYTNIRYAEPPVRFEPSKPHDTRWNGIQNATGEMLYCAQFDGFFKTLRGQEDCLFLNVFTPKNTEDKKLLPVFVFIHGGAFMFGGAGFYSPKIFMSEGGMIVVSLNYRLGPLGFLTTEDGVIPGNLGLKDQLLALRWIKTNIHHFGGDPDKILLAGQSAGAASVHLQMLRKETESLVSAAIAISGTALNPWVMQINPKEKTDSLVKHLNCSSVSHGKDIKSCLQDQPLEKLHTAVMKMLMFLDSPFNLFGAVVEREDTPGAFLTAEPKKLIERGEIANVPWMVTMTTEEGAYNAGSLLKKDDNGVEHIEELNERWLELAPYLLFYYNEPCCQCKQKLSESLREMYMGTDRFSTKSYLRLQKMFTDVVFANGILEAIKLHRMFGAGPVYGYVYSNSHKNGVGNFLASNDDVEFGATHGDDEALFLPLTISTNSTSSKTNDLKISKYFVKMFKSFALKGIPSFKDTLLPGNKNNLQPMQFLQIFEKNYCFGPWESSNNQECQKLSNQCFDY